MMMAFRSFPCISFTESTLTFLTRLSQASADQSFGGGAIVTYQTRLDRRRLRIFMICLRNGEITPISNSESFFSFRRLITRSATTMASCGLKNEGESPSCLSSPSTPVRACNRVRYQVTCYLCCERTVEEHWEFKVGQHLPPTELIHFVGWSHGGQLPVVEMLGGVGQDGRVRPVVLDQLQKAVVGLVDRQVCHPLLVDWWHDRCLQ